MVYLTREEYEALRERAVAQYERLRAIVPNENEIVYVLTRDVYRAAMAIDTTPHTHMTVGFGRNGIYGLFQGARVCVVNEATDDSMFAPAVCGRVYYQGMQLEDVILIEDNHLYSLRNIEPDVMFVDTGLTVSFGDEQQTAADRAADMAATVAVDNAVTVDATVPAGVGIGITVHDYDPATVYATQAPRLDIDWDEIRRVMDEYTPTIGIDTANAVTLNAGDVYIDHEFFGRAFAPTMRAAQNAYRRQAKPKEEELSPGDTKELDDFLDSFVRSAT